MKAARKIVHKNLIYLVNSSYGIILLILSLTITIIAGFQLLLLSIGFPHYFYAFKAHHLDKLTTIYTVDQNHFSQYPPIDAVYTWVNGSDPIWKKKKSEWARVHRREMLLENLTSSFNMSNSSHDMLFQLLNISNSTELPDNEDDATAANRYRDNDELKYSLRSLIKNAPWIHHVYLVTDNQVPSWLNLQSPHITVVPHTSIFLNSSHLPVFNSASIETHLHRIPGLSRYFVYFNDDVFLGAPVLPEDFMSVSGVQRFYTAWEVPRCALGCSEAWIGDGYCDNACNVKDCDFDFPDCVNVTSTSQQTAVQRRKGPDAQCKPGCPDSWLADKVCDMRCKYEECGWDLGDCGLEAIVNSFPGYNLTLTDIAWNTLDAGDNTTESHLLLPLSSSSNGSAYPVVFQVPVNVTACYLNLTSVLLDDTVWSYFASHAPVSNAARPSPTDFLDGITYQPMRPVLSDQQHVRSCVIVPKEHVLIVLFDTTYSTIAGNYSSDGGNTIWLPRSYDLSVTVAGSYSHFGVPFNITFAIQIQGDETNEAQIYSTHSESVDIISTQEARGETLMRNLTSTFASDRRLSELQESEFQASGIEENTFRFVIERIFAEYYRLIADKSHASFINHHMKKYPYSRRRLSESAYRDSLVFVNRLYTRFYGKEARKVPAHMPHLIDRDAMEELQVMWPDQWNTTSQHRFRSGRDMQYAFAYFHHLVNRHKGRPPAFQTRQVLQLLHDLVDADGDSMINRNEFHTLAAMVSGRSPTIFDMHELLNNCTNATFSVPVEATETAGSAANYSFLLNETESTNAYQNSTNSSETFVELPASIYLIPESLQAPIKYFAECMIVKDGIFKYFDWSERSPTHQVSNGDKSVSFEMITDNATHTRMQLDSIRQKHLKFVCVNDNLEQPTPALERLLRDFYISYFPQPSPFELPQGVINPSLYLDECLRELGTFSNAFESPLFVAAIFLSTTILLITLLKMFRRDSSLKES